MPYSVELSALALRQLHILDKVEADRIFAKLAEAAANPDHYFKRLTGFEESSLRVGDRRAVAYVDHARKQVLVESVGHRSVVYKRMK